MTSTIEIIKGENFLVRRDLKQSNNMALALVDVESATVKLIQNQYEKVYEYPSDELREGLNSSQLELEITTDISELLLPGKAELVWDIRVTNSAFTVEGFQRDIIHEKNLILIKDNK